MGYSKFLLDATLLIFWEEFYNHSIDLVILNRHCHYRNLMAGCISMTTEIYSKYYLLCN